MSDITCERRTCFPQQGRTPFQEKGNAMILSCENAPHTTGAVHACAHTNTTVIHKENRRTGFRKQSDMTPP